ncbi:caa(3)-type oxidase, subunit IV [Candidatus Kryptobacter tengchongensis]|uniref:Caa(3)-type oxidase, subunit IV n=1 Tax=Kryptobacter tengchongensis TaxID=1643429 RepID=A0A656D0P5_KRYT1|nr:cytochrome C oxidase subunit IV family protein [Candidatus Kryptobacter tengchongensis]CUS93681.1 caa(3)-type oxidase, subunit IV [Candidatus Kryptobacter tengchongensis]CUS95894.1 caa(3)-type oxidase, subunit IV [Candidatus Kryptobacter tengchongensis]CUT03896.1 caa(3)-type oxidase, subunit IV [Candidatus Kryptobacter tengchongensis]CUU02216.1 caa(3)-type oxidase, subunit IV [Candidatus Kryptobacter tengchongensis]
MTEMTHKSSKKIYWRVWFQLLAITIVEIIVAFLPISHSLMALLFTIMALMKASLIAGYFMHLKFEQLGLVYSIVLPLILIVALAAALIPDGSVALLMRLGLGY